MAEPTFTYGNDPSTSDTDLVRLLIGDTTCDKALLSDEEIAHFIATAGSAVTAAPRCARAIAARCARDVTYGAGSHGKSLSDLTKHYNDLARELDANANRLVQIYCGGISVDERLSDRLDTDLIQPHVETGIFGNPDAPSRPDGDEGGKGRFV